MDKDTLQKAKELERDVKSITRILEEHDKHHHLISVNLQNQLQHPSCTVL